VALFASSGGEAAQSHALARTETNAQYNQHETIPSGLLVHYHSIGDETLVLKSINDVKHDQEHETAYVEEGRGDDDALPLISSLSCSYFPCQRLRSHRYLLFSSHQREHDGKEEVEN
jgi:hypothetical protein